MKERAFILLKPDGVPRETEILAILAPHAKVIAARRFPKAPLRRLAGLYAEHQGKLFYPWLLDYFRGRPVKAFILEPKKTGPAGGFHKTLAAIVGATDPKKAAQGTIRALSDDDMTLSMRQKRTVRNLVHRSLTPGESLREGSLFFFDWSLEPETSFEPGPFIFPYINPLSTASGGPDVEGIFYEDRLAFLLRKTGLLPSGARLKGYRESTTRKKGDASVILHLSYLLKGKLEEREIDILD
jgi:nucleoside diphosphate kinase